VISEHPQTQAVATILQRAKRSFRIAAIATWTWGVVVLCQTLFFRDQYEDILTGVVALVAFTALLGLGIYRGSRICILVVTIMVLYNWSQLFQYFSWPEWILAILFVLAVSGGFIGAVIYHRVRAREAA